MRKVYRIALLAALALPSCSSKPPSIPPLTPITSGTIEVAGLSAPVRVVRDRWGIPHVYAETATDLFIAQGFVQAEDRLFQMDLWRRASLGRLAEVLGANFAERDMMTRRMQYAGAMEAEWESYAPDARAIAAAFVRGVNAWVARAHDNPPEEFRLAGWTPAFWSETDLLNRTDAFLSSGDALDEVRRLGMSTVVADAIRLVGPPPFFVTLTGSAGAAPDGRTSAPPPSAPDATFVRRGQAAVDADGRLMVEESSRRLDVPSRRYAVHLHAPGWNVAGIAAPWLPGVVIGHNENAAWGATPIEADTQDLAIERVSPGEMARAADMIRIKGRPHPLTFQRESTARGVVVATDAEAGRVFTLRWAGFLPGAAAELAAIAIDRARTAQDVRDSLARWKFPAGRFVFVAGGQAGRRDAAAGRVLDAKGAAEGEPPPARAAAFVHALSVGPDARRRFDVGPVASGASGPVRALFDPRDWDQSQVLVAPGLSASAGSAHYADLAAAWSRGEMVPLVFSDAAVARHAAETLTLVPAARHP